MSSRPQLLSGARGLIKNGATVLAVATDITVNTRHNVRPTYVVGDMNAAAIDTLSYDVDVSVGRVIPINAAGADANPPAGTVAPRATTITAIELSLETVIALMTSATDLNIVLEDRVTGATIASVRGCRFSGRTESMNATDVATERLNFTGIYNSGYSAPGGTPDNAATDGYGL
jgi:hypothetical protein